MIVEEGSGLKMPCESCAVQFSVFKRRRVCSECERFYCSSCLRRGGGAMCAPCRVLSTRPLSRSNIAHLKVRDLQCFLQRQNVSTRGCVEKEELLSLCVCHVNSVAYRRRGAGWANWAGGGRAGVGAFSSLKGLTNNINDLINSAFDLRPAPAAYPAPAPAPAPAAYPAPAPASAPPSSPPQQNNTQSCFNASHMHRPSAPPTERDPPPPPHRRPERFNPRPGGERDVDVAAPGGGDGGVSRRESGESARVESADCFEIEDLDEAGWEFVARPAAPLPNDSEVLLSATLNAGMRRISSSHEELGELPTQYDSITTPEIIRLASETTRLIPEAMQPTDSRQTRPLDDTIPDFQTRNILQNGSQDNSIPGVSYGHVLSGRAASELELRAGAGGGGGAGGPDDSGEAGGGSLNDVPCLERETHSEHSTPGRVSLGGLESAAQLEALTVKQLKELLAANRVEYRGCLERRDLLQRARLLWRDHRRHRRHRDELESLPLEECCKICMGAPLECVLLECGHIAACTSCAKQLAECPICRQYVVRAVRCFRS